jgi:soluble lytic murein transglycosylase
MKRRKFAGREGRDQAKPAERESDSEGMRRRAPVLLLASALALLGTADALSAPQHKPASSTEKNAAQADRHKAAPPNQKKATEAEHHKPATPDRKKAAEAEHHKPAAADRKKAAEEEHHKPASPDGKNGKDGKKAADHHKPGSSDQKKAEEHEPAPPEQKKAVEEKHHKHMIEQPAAGDAAEPPSPDLVAAKQAFELVGLGKARDAAALAATIGDPVVVKLVEWARLRGSDSEAGFDRYVAFMSANPDWPNKHLLRRRAETRLWQERRDGATVRSFVGNEPTSAIGRLALARVEMAEGDRAGAESEVRAVWQSAPLSDALETAVLAAFPDVLTRADHVARMDRRIGAKEFGAAMRAAKRVGDDQIAIVKACSAAEAKSTNGGALLDGVRAEAREDLGYALCRVHWLMRNDTPGSNVRGRVVTPKGDIAAATKLTLAAEQSDLRRQDTDEWWRERRALARKLIDLGDATTAYQVVRDAAPPANPYYRAEFHFMAGWIALRFLEDPATAAEHFAHVDDGMTDPIARARAAYWRGRAAEAAGRIEEMRAQYEAAARYPTAYYGQLARARLGLDDVAELRSLPDPVDGEANELLHAADILYKIGEGDLALSFVSGLAEESRDPAVIAGLGQLTARYNDAQAMLLVGKTALARGLPTDLHAFPDIGVPNYGPVGPEIDRSIVYAIARTESGFDQGDKSAAKAVGLMQVTPGAARDTARRFGVAYDWNRLVSDRVYNTQMGAAEIAALLKDYRGSFVLTFAGYNAGRGRVQQWVAQHGDPRDPRIDAVDWVERIPFSETRNYVQRVMENLQVYRARFGATIATTEPNLHRAATFEPAAQRPVPTTVELSVPR